jgi:UDP-N-acetylglucosamine diphosphorylase/glucosamine-1-phosphate N-acetyltransferase
MNIILFDDDTREKLLPLTYTKPVGMLRLGIMTIQEKWQKYFSANVSFITQDYLSDKFPIVIKDRNYVVNASVLPTFHICKLIEQLQENEALLKDGELIAALLNENQFENLIQNEDINELKGFEIGETPLLQIKQLSDLFSLNAQAIQHDFEQITKNRETLPVPSYARVIGRENVFIEEGADVSICMINATEGPVYIGKGAKIMEGCLIRGPFVLGNNSVLKMGAKIYGGTTLGPHCKVGGEVNNVVMQGYSNKGHEGYLGNAVIGEWCNLGADTNNSNLKNNYAEVKLWDYSSSSFAKTGLQFCGMIMGDHSKAGINTMFNTGTVAGVACNVYGAGYQKNFIPSFTWGGPDSSYKTHRIDKVIETANLVMARRGLKLSTHDEEILKHVFDLSSEFRAWERQRSA